MSKLALIERDIAIKLEEVEVELDGPHYVNIQVTFPEEYLGVSARRRCVCSNKVHDYAADIDGNRITVRLIGDGIRQAGSFTYDFGDG
jgi:hypothetical protein